jgi:hypothetical protein
MHLFPMGTGQRGNTSYRAGVPLIATNAGKL